MDAPPLWLERALAGAFGGVVVVVLFFAFREIASRGRGEERARERTGKERS